MKFIILAIFIVFIVGIYSENLATAQLVTLNDIDFLQTGELHTVKNQFHISNELDIREFFNGNIIRVSGQTIEGFPYITYSKILEKKIETHGVIFVTGKFVELSFDKEMTMVNKNIEKNDDLAISTQYTQRVYSKQIVQIDVKVFDVQQNKLSDFYQNYGYIKNATIVITMFDEEGQVVFSSEGITDDNGLFNTEYIMPDNSKRETLTIAINVENENSKSSKILQLFSFGNIQSNNKSDNNP